MTPRSSLCVYGPTGCGKTRNAAALREAFGLDRVVDDWNGKTPVPSFGALILTNTPDAEVDARVFGVRVESYRAAMALAGLHA